MKIYLLSLGAGLLAGILYGVLNVRSPAPPVVALVGLLGILLGEQVPPLVRQWLAPKEQQVSWLHVTGNFVLLGREVVAPGNDVLLKLLAFPAFVGGVVAVRALVRRRQRMARAISSRRRFAYERL